MNLIKAFPYTHGVHVDREQELVVFKLGICNNYNTKDHSFFLHSSGKTNVHTAWRKT